MRDKCIKIHKLNEGGSRIYIDISCKENMKLYRYMSVWEFIRMSRGEEIKPYVYGFKADTGSKGLCFIGEKTLVEAPESTEYFSPLRCLKFLEGIVNDEMLVEFEIQDTDAVQTSWGKYSNPFNEAWGSTINITEYCMMSYQKDTLVPTRYLFPIRSRSEDDFIEYEDGKIDVRSIIEQAPKDSLIKFSLLPQIPDGKGFWSEVYYVEPGIGEERTNDEWKKLRLVYGDLATGEEQYSMEMVLDSVDMSTGAKYVRFVLSEDCPPSWEGLVDDFRGFIGESADGTYWKSFDTEKWFKDFFKFVALCTAYPELEKHYRLFEKNSYTLDMIKKDFDIDEVRKRYSEIGADKIKALGLPALETRRTRNSIGEMLIQKVGEEYEVYVINFGYYDELGQRVGPRFIPISEKYRKCIESESAIRKIERKACLRDERDGL